MNAAKTAMSSKILGPESSFFAEMAVDAVTAVRTESGGDLGKKASKQSTLSVSASLPLRISVFSSMHGCLFFLHKGIQK